MQKIVAYIQLHKYGAPSPGFNIHCMLVLYTTWTDIVTVIPYPSEVFMPVKSHELDFQRHMLWSFFFYVQRVNVRGDCWPSHLNFPFFVTILMNFRNNSIVLQALFCFEKKNTSQILPCNRALTTNHIKHWLVGWYWESRATVNGS